MGAQRRQRTIATSLHGVHQSSVPKTRLGYAPVNAFNSSESKFVSCRIECKQLGYQYRPYFPPPLLFVIREYMLLYIYCEFV